jgi:hypothetical protein
MTGQKCNHHLPIPRSMGYVQWMEENDRRHDAGQKQKRCRVCRYWFWADEMGTPPKKGKK